MLATISTILRAVFLGGVSNTQSTLSVPAPGWQSAQSNPSESAMTPMALRKSSGVSSFSVLVVTFLKYVPDFTAVPAAGFAAGACAAARSDSANPMINPAEVPAAASINRFDQILIYHPSLKKSVSDLSY